MNSCQLTQLVEMSEGEIKVHHSWARRVKLMIKRRASPAAIRQWKWRWYRLTGRQSQGQTPMSNGLNLQAGERVRVRTVEEIEATLNPSRQLRGCSFMAEMRPWCGTTQRVLKPVRRFLDERDYRVKETHGIVILEEVRCEGTGAFGPCDRACYFFWREEWLERAPAAIFS